MMYNNKFFSTFTILFLALILSSTSSSAQHYWVGGSGDWQDNTTHWATTSGGSSFHTSAPSASDDVYFDSNSFTAIGQVVSFTETDNYCNSFSCTGTLYLPLFQMDIEPTLHINSSLNVTNEAIYNFSNISMESFNGGNTINTNGTSLGTSAHLFIDGTGEFNLSGSIEVGNMYFRQGIFNTNDYPLTISNYIETEGDLMKTINLGNAIIDCGTWITAGSNNTLNSGTSIIFTRQIHPDTDNSGPYNYATVKFKNTGNNPGLVYGSGNFETIDATILNEFTEISLKFSPGTTIGIGEILTTGDIHNPLIFAHNNSYNENNPVTFVKSNGSLDLSYVEMQGFHATGGASFNVNPGIDNGDNDGWNITEITPIEYYWINDTGDWLDLTHWSSTSGGSNDLTDFPSKYDNVFFDENSFSSADQEVFTDNSTTITTNNLVWSENVNSPLFNVLRLDIYGDYIVSDAVEMNLGYLSLKSNNNVVVRTSNQGTIDYIFAYGLGELNIDSDITASGLLIYAGTFNSNDYNFYLEDYMDVYFGNDKIINLGSSEIITGEFEVSCYSCEVNALQSSITVTNSFRGGANNAYNYLAIDGDAISYQSNTFNILDIKPGASARFNGNQEIIIIDELIINGTPSMPVNIYCAQAGTPFTFIKSSGVVNADYLIIQDNIATGGATFNANQSIDNGNNTGWNITAPVPHDYYWVGDGGNWSDNMHWATTSGGSSYYDYAPGSLDNIYFDSNSFSSNNQVVTLDQSIAYCSTMDWTGVTNSPSIVGEESTISCAGSLTLSENMLAEVEEFDFTGTGNHTIDTGFENSPGFNTTFTFSSAGTWDILHPLNLYDFRLESGTVNTNGNNIHCELHFVFLSDQPKEIHMGTSSIYSRIFGYQYASNGIIDAGEADVHVFQYITPQPYNGGLGTETWDLNHLTMGNSTETNTTTLVKEIWGSVTVNQLTLEHGIEFSIQDNQVITVNQLIAQGTEIDHINIHSFTTGVQVTINQSTGTVDGQYLDLQDVSATGDATFYANNSIDLGNVTGWIFTNIQQSINFPVIDDVLEDVGEITLSATASSGLEISYSVDFGPATVSANILTITGSGEIQVSASQSGDDVYSAAVSQTNNFCSAPLTPTITSVYYEDYVTLTANDSQLCVWYRNGVIIENTPTETIDVTQTGIYTAQRTSDDCESGLSNEINVTVISVEEIQEYQVLNFYPNPVSSEIMISNIDQGNSEIMIFDIYGKLVSQFSILEAQNNTTRINISYLTKGVYFLTLTTKNGIYSNKLIKE